MDLICADAHPFQYNTIMASFQDDIAKPVLGCQTAVDFVQQEMMEVALVTTGTVEKCNAPVKSSPSTNYHPTCYRPGALPVTQPTVSSH